jgi:hypothetical protein
MGASVHDDSSDPVVHLLDHSKPGEFLTVCGRPIAKGTLDVVGTYTMSLGTFRRAHRRCHKCEHQ